MLASFIEVGRGQRERGASQTSSETLLPFDIGLLSGPEWRRSNPGHNAALEQLNDSCCGWRNHGLGTKHRLCPLPTAKT